MRISSHYPTTVVIDGELLRLLIRKLNRDEWITFASEFDRLEKVRRGQELLLDRKPGEEALKAEDVEAKRLMELSPEGREQRLKEELEENRRSTVFCTESIEAYVKAAPDALFDEDENRYVTDGADIVRLFAQRHDVLSTFLAEIWLQNRLPTDAKKNLSLLRASQRGSHDNAAATGSSPAPTAASVAPETSVEPAAVTGSPETSPSGAMGSSS